MPERSVLKSFPLCPWAGVLARQDAFYLGKALLLFAGPLWIKGLCLSICAEPLLPRLLSPLN